MHKKVFLVSQQECTTVGIYTAYKYSTWGCTQCNHCVQYVATNDTNKSKVTLQEERIA